MLEISGDVAAAAAAFSGLILVFFGAALTDFATYTVTQQVAVRNTYRLRAWPAFAALFAAVSSCGLSLLAKATASATAAGWGCALLGVTAILIVALGVIALLEIK